MSHKFYINQLRGTFPFYPSCLQFSPALVSWNHQWHNYFYFCRIAFPHSLSSIYSVILPLKCTNLLLVLPLDDEKEKSTAGDCTGRKSLEETEIVRMRGISNKEVTSEQINFYRIAWFFFPLFFNQSSSGNPHQTGPEQLTVKNSGKDLMRACCSVSFSCVGLCFIQIFHESRMFFFFLQFKPWRLLFSYDYPISNNLSVMDPRGNSLLNTKKNIQKIRLRM